MKGLLCIVLASILVVASCEKPTGEAPKTPVEAPKTPVEAPPKLPYEDTSGEASEPKQWHVSTVAGSDLRHFDRPYGIAVSPDGTLYVADRPNDRIRKIDTSGGVTTIAGSTDGYKDATGTDAQFRLPTGIAVSSNGTLYVADAFNHRIRKIDTSGAVTTIAGSTDGYKDATGTDAQFNYPYGVAVTSDGTLYVADTFNDRIRKIDTSGAVTTIAGSDWGHEDAAGTDAQFKRPDGVAVTSDGTLYVADTSNHRIRKIDLSSGAVTTIAGSTRGHKDAAGTDAEFSAPSGIAVSSDGTLYVADTYNHCIRKIEFK